MDSVENLRRDSEYPSPRPNGVPHKLVEMISGLFDERAKRRLRSR